ncbi:unnamed protein product, partial (macronuclear) [Paramecium tetraurelia]
NIMIQTTSAMCLTCACLANLRAINEYVPWLVRIIVSHQEVICNLRIWQAY